MGYLLVFMGGGLDSVLRHGVNVLTARFWGTQYPIGTLCINVLGSFAMGVVVEYLAMKSGLSQQARLFLTTGVIGGFTTFSTFSLEVATLSSRGEIIWAAFYIASSIIFGVGGFYTGMTLVRLAT